jgi:hypothetical protein
MKRCSKCEQTRTKAEFSRNTLANDGLDAWCKPCRKDYSASKRINKLPAREPSQCRKCWEFFDYEVATYCKTCRSLIGQGANLKKYGLTVDDYIKMEQERGGLCDACGKPETKRARLSIDHDHNCCAGNTSCGKCIRGLLCFRCNTALGLIYDDPDTLRKMLAYLG